MIRLATATRLACAIAVLCGTALPAGGQPASEEPRRVLVKFRAEGPHALGDCAQRLTSRGRSLRDATADRSDSLDELHRRLRVRGVRALFRRPDERPFAEQRRRMRERHEAARPPGRSGAPLPDLSHVYEIELPSSADSEEAAALYRRDAHVEWAQPDYRTEVTFVPNDPFFSSSGSWGQPYADLWGLHRIRADVAWDTSRGEGVVVAVVDTGLDYGHPDIDANVWMNPGEDPNGNGIDDDGNGFIDDLRGFDFHNSKDTDGDGRYDGESDVPDADPFDDNGHGSHVAGTIAAELDNGLGIAGVAPSARIMPLKAFSAGGSGFVARQSQAIVYAAENGALVINNSWSCNTPCPSNPVAEEAVLLAHGLGAVVVFSAGNSRIDVANFSPQNMPETIAVGASDENDAPANFTNVGFGIDVAAPGGGDPAGPAGPAARRNILSLLSSGAPALAGSSLVVADHYLRLSGTSMSAPHVAGVAALVRSLRPALSNEEVRSILRLSARDVGPPGPDATYGAGILDAAAAIARDFIPDVSLEIASPRPGQSVALGGGPVDVLGTATGADFVEYSLFVGVGSRPSVWEPLVSSRPERVEDEPLGTWDPADLEQGNHVLRLDVIASDGSILSEFDRVYVERNPPIPVSSVGPDAEAPSISGSYVVWHSARDVGEEPEGVNLFLTDVSTGEEIAIAHGPENEQDGSIDGNLVAWKSTGQNVTVCTLGAPVAGSQEPCAPAVIRTGVDSASKPIVGGDHVLWQETQAGPSQIFHCAIDESGRCPAAPLAPAPYLQIEPHHDGSRAVWVDGRNSPSFEVFTCLFDATGACPARSLGGRGLPVTPAVDGEVVAWTDFSTFEGRLAVCEIGSAGECDPLFVTNTVSIPQPRVSKRRVVWEDFTADGRRDIFFCEFDPLAFDCPIQRIVAEPSAQHSPDIDGNLVVWQDERSVFSEIVMQELPALEPIGPRSVREGRRLRIPLASGDRDGPPALEASQMDGVPIEEMGATLRDFGDGTGEIEWTPGFEQAGEYLLTVTATAPGLLKTRETFPIRVEDRNRRPVVVTRPWHVAWVGTDLVLSACDSYDPDGEPLSFRWRGRGQQLGESCSLRVESPDETGLELFRIVASDGERRTRRWVLVVWLRPFFAAGG